ncbi:hypothetical protein BV22DRAFT_1050429 [Leucogyrophana mollusca]|uniref:Uncharacterized protein n=1 Tax=Leucogyrophana mollusca TaxID=85980 RepID=A0ACB8B508_9AGAM|nr:hypothetical protein BV22DRAFT_1050429 [Leucogyrophana mollusca]
MTMDIAEPVKMVTKCWECSGSRWQANGLQGCRWSKAKCSLLPESERKQERARMVVSLCTGEKQKKNKIAVVVKAMADDWHKDGEHQNNCNALGALSQSLLGLTDQVYEFWMDIQRGLQLLNHMVITLESMVGIEPGSPNAYVTDEQEEEEGLVTSRSARSR